MFLYFHVNIISVFRQIVDLKCQKKAGELISRNLLPGTKKTREIIHQVSRYLDQDSNRVSHEQKSRALRSPAYLVQG
jgi:hypothetical protein